MENSAFGIYQPASSGPLSVPVSSSLAFTDTGHSVHNVSQSGVIASGGHVQTSDRNTIHDPAGELYSGHSCNHSLTPSYTLSPGVSTNFLIF